MAKFTLCIESENADDVLAALANHAAVLSAKMKRDETFAGVTPAAPAVGENSPKKNKKATKAETPTAPAATAEAPKTEAAKDDDFSEFEPAPAFTQQQVSDKLIALGKKFNSRALIDAFIEHLGYKKFKDVPAEKYAEAMKLAEAGLGLALTPEQVKSGEAIKLIVAAVKG